MGQTQLFEERFFPLVFMLLLLLFCEHRARHFGISIWLSWLSKRTDSKHCSSSCRFWSDLAPGLDEGYQVSFERGCFCDTVDRYVRAAIDENAVFVHEKKCVRKQAWLRHFNELWLVNEIEKTKNAWSK